MIRTAWTKALIWLGLFVLCFWAWNLLITWLFS